MTERQFDQERFRTIASRLNPNIPDPTGVREAIKSGCYADIFKSLRPLPYAVQEKLLIQGYGDPRVGMSNGESVARELVRINNIKWFSPTEVVDKGFIEEKAHEIQTRLAVPPMKLEIISNNWDAAWDAAWWSAAWGVAWSAAQDAARDAAWGAARNDSFEAARDAARNATFEAASDASYHAARNATFEAASDASYHAATDVEWIVVEDIMKDHPLYYKGNPFSPIVDLYSKGLWPIGQTGDNFIVFHPEVTSLAS